MKNIKLVSGFLAISTLMLTGVVALGDDDVAERLGNLPASEMPLGTRIRFTNDLALPVNKITGAVICAKGDCWSPVENIMNPGRKIERLGSESEQNRHVTQEDRSSNQEEYDKTLVLASHCVISAFKGFDGNTIEENSWFQVTRVQPLSKHDVSYTFGAISAAGDPMSKEFTVDCIGRTVTVAHYVEQHWRTSEFNRCDFAECGQSTFHTRTESQSTDSQPSDVLIADFLRALDSTTDFEFARRRPKKSVSIYNSSYESRYKNFGRPAGE